jgi:hypothetical protein
MNTLLRLSLMLSAWCWLCLLPAAARAESGDMPRDLGGSARRFALIASANDGGKERTRLRFADSDAAATSRVLQRLGGVRQEDVILLSDATRASLEAAFANVGARIAQSDQRVRDELFVYYSGHSDELGLLLAGERVSFAEMRRWIDGTLAEVRIAVLDSCASGAVIRERGGVRRPPFLSDLSVHARGHAFLTASSADEAAQESDRIQGGFFTHYFLSGLRGAADTSRDGRVTLAEAYQFSYGETLRRTELISGRAQHPAYDIQLAGTGDLVLTDLRSTAASLVLEEKVAGRVFVRDEAGRLMVELHKEPLYPVQLGFDPGGYEVVLDGGGRTAHAKVVLREGAPVRLGPAAFIPEAGEPVAARGDGVATEASTSDDEEAGSETTTLLDMPLSFGGYAGVSFRYSRLFGQDGFVAGAEMALLFAHRLAIGVSGYGGESESDDGLSFGYGGVIVRYHFPFENSPFYLSLGALSAAGAASEGSGDGGTGEDNQDSDAVFVFEPQVSGHLNVTRWLRLGVDVGYRLVAGSERFAARDLRSPIAGFHAQLGWF